MDKKNRYVMFKIMFFIPIVIHVFILQFFFDNTSLFASLYPWFLTYLEACNATFGIYRKACK